MAKLKNVQFYSIDEVPEDLTNQCKDLAIQLAQMITPILEENKNEPNIIFGAITFLHAAIIKHLVSDDPEELQKATEIAAIGLLKNIEFLNEMKK